MDGIAGDVPFRPENTRTRTGKRKKQNKNKTKENYETKSHTPDGIRRIEKRKGNRKIEIFFHKKKDEIGGHAMMRWPSIVDSLVARRLSHDNAVFYWFFLPSFTKS